MNFCNKVLLTLVICVSFAATAFTQPTGFTDELYVGSWSNAVGMTFDDNGRMYVWEKRGMVWIVDQDGNKLPNPLIDIREEVGNWRDFGLLGFALDPNFLSNGRFYLNYLVDRHHLLYFGTNNYDSGTNEYFDATIGRITRYTAEASSNYSTTDYDSRQVLVGETPGTGMPSLHQSHGIGSLVFGTDGTLLACFGDGASYSSVDQGSASETYYQQAIDDGIIPANHNIGAYRCQLLSSHNGKILRIDPETGDGVPSNPFYQAANPRSANSRTWSLGVRNPYKMCKRPGTGSHFPEDADPGSFYFGDVGWTKGEELNVINAPGQNFGWPKYEGMTHQPGYNNSTYAPSSHELAKVDWRTGTPRASVNGTIYNIGSSEVPGPSFPGNASTGGTWYTGTDFPEEYQNTYFHADYGGKWIRNFVFDENDQPVEVKNFIDNGGSIVGLATHPIEGALYYVKYPSEIRKVSYTGSQSFDPIAIATASSYSGAGPQTISFNGGQSYDPDGGNLSYNWDFGDGSTSTDPYPVHGFTPSTNNPINYTVTLTVTDNEGDTGETTFTISLNNTAPIIIFTSVDGINTFNSTTGANLSLSASVADNESPNSALSYEWQVSLFHNNHHHEEPVVTSPTSTAVLSPIGCDGTTYWYRIRLTITDPQGLSNTFYKDIFPDCAETNQTIAFNALADKELGDPDFTISATASSGLDVQFFVVDGPALIVGNEVQLTGVGEVTIRAIQSGNETYAPAVAVEQSFYVFNPDAPTDNVSPSVILSTASNSVSEPFTVYATFSEPVTGFALNDIAVTNGASSNLVGSGTYYSFTVSPTASGAVTVKVNANGVFDIANNGNTASNTLTVDYSSCTDNDNDGFCAADDCNDNNPNLPTTPGTTCNDGNANTENDVILADGCTCEGTPIGGGSCSDISISADGSTIIVGGFSAYPNMNITVFNSSWGTVDNCVGDCGSSFSSISLANGSYFVSVKSFDMNWQPECDIFETIQVGGGGCTDNDNDGFCVADDCDDNNPNLPATVGSACNDGNANTNNDVIQADGCTCQGTPIGGGDCADIQITTSGSTISVSNLTGFDHVNVQIFNSAWVVVESCFDDCGATYTTPALADGSYQVIARTYSAAWVGICDILETNIQVGGGGCTDNDNDGFCAADDCNDNNPNLPTTVGSACNDGNPNTSNDVIQANGCTCQGTPVGGGSCSDIVVSADGSTIVVEGIGNFPHISITVFNSSWATVESCVDNCGSPFSTNNLADGTYYVSVKSFDVNWQPDCDLLETIQVGGGGCTDNDNDGYCAANDCDDNNPNLPTTVGSTCNDGNPNTTNDVIQADGCTCQGTTTGGGNCSNIAISNTTNSISISGLESFPHMNIKIFNSSWATVDGCLDDCGTTFTASDLSGGTYYVSVKPFDASWQPICDILEPIQVGSNLEIGDQSILYLATQKMGRMVSIEWATNTNDKSERYLIERSNNGEHYYDYMEVTSTNEQSNALIRYQQIDGEPLLGENHYRIKEVRKDGSIHYTNVQKVVFTIDITNFSLFPNPSRGNIFVNLTPYVGKAATIVIYNYSGQKIDDLALEAIPEYPIRFDLTNQVNGMYTISIKVEGYKPITKPFVLNRTY